MTQQPDERKTYNRRSVLGMTGAALLGRGLTTSTGDSAPTYTIRQGSRCLPLRPLRGSDPVEDFYDYRAPFTDPSGGTYSSHGTVDLQRNDTSILFLYEGPGGVSLVVVHGKLDSAGGGGSASFDIEGLPAGGEWVVEDDRYDGPSNYDVWNHGETTSAIDWTWAGGRTDGGAFRGLGDASVTIRPAFNEAAALFGQYYEGRVTRWQALSREGTGVARHTLRRDRAVVVQSGSCAPDTTEAATVVVDVVPGAVNPSQQGRLPVVVRGEDGFDAGTIDPDSVAFGPNGAGPVQSRTRRRAGHPELLLHFDVPSLGLDHGDSSADFAAETRSGRPVRGTARFRTVGGNGRSNDGDGQSNGENGRDRGRGDGREDDDSGGNDGNDGRGRDDRGNGRDGDRGRGARDEREDDDDDEDREDERDDDEEDDDRDDDDGERDDDEDREGERDDDD